jgi:hypothetical protein
LFVVCMHVLFGTNVAGKQVHMEDKEPW